MISTRQPRSYGNTKILKRKTNLWIHPNRETNTCHNTRQKKKSTSGPLEVNSNRQQQHHRASSKQPTRSRKTVSFVAVLQYTLKKSIVWPQVHKQVRNRRKNKYLQLINGRKQNYFEFGRSFRGGVPPSCTYTSVKTTSIFQYHKNSK